MRAEEENERGRAMSGIQSGGMYERYSNREVCGVPRNWRDGTRDWREATGRMMQVATLWRCTGARLAMRPRRSMVRCRLVDRAGQARVVLSTMKILSLGEPCGAAPIYCHPHLLPWCTLPRICENSQNPMSRQQRIQLDKVTSFKTIVQLQLTHNTLMQNVSMFPNPQFRENTEPQLQNVR